MSGTRDEDPPSPQNRPLRPATPPFKGPTAGGGSPLQPPGSRLGRPLFLAHRTSERSAGTADPQPVAGTTEHSTRDEPASDDACNQLPPKRLWNSSEELDEGAMDDRESRQLGVSPGKGEEVPLSVSANAREPARTPSFLETDAVDVPGSSDHSASGVIAELAAIAEEMAATPFLVESAVAEASETIADALERTARRVRSGEIQVPALRAPVNEAAALAATLAELLKTSN